MEEILKFVLDAVASGGPLAITGWGLFALERFYTGPAREKAHKEQEKYFKDTIEAFRDDHTETSTKTVEALHRLTTLLEIIKDRAGRV